MTFPRCPRLTILSLTILLMLSATTPLYAQDDRARAQKVFQKGQQQFENGSYKDAAVTFLQAFQLDPHPVIMYNVARGHEEAGELIKALQYYRTALELGPSKAVREEIALKVEDIEQFLKDQGVDVRNLETARWDPKGVLSVRTDPPAAQVTITSEEGDRIERVAPIEGKSMAQGEYRVVIEQRGFASERRRIWIVAGKSYVLNVELQTEAAATPREAPGYLDLSAPRRGLMVFVDGEPLAATPVGKVELSPGEHTVSVEGEDFPTYEERFTVVSGETHRINAVIPAPVVIKQEDTSLLSRREWGLVTMGAGAVIVGAGGVFGLIAQSHANDYESDRGAFGRSTSRDNAESNAITADILYGLGVAVVATGGVIVLFAGDGGETDPGVYGGELVRAPQPGFSLDPAVYEGGAGLRATGVW